MFSITKFTFPKYKNVSTVLLKCKTMYGYSFLNSKNMTMIHLSRMMFSTNIKEKMEQKLKEHFDPSFLQVNQESKNNFQVIIESKKFEGVSTLNRHRKVNEILKDEISQIHAFSVIANAPKNK